MKYVREHSDRPASLPAMWHQGADPFLRQYPALVEYLDLDRFDDGRPRATSTLLVFVDAGVLKACLNDRQMGEVAFVSAASFEGLLEALEKGLAEGSLDWRQAGAGRSKKKR